MSNLNAILANAAIQSFDTAVSVVRVNSPLGSIILPATNSSYFADFQVTTTIAQIPLAAAIVYAAFFRSWSSNTVNINLSIQPNGQSATTFQLAPGGLYIYWQPTEPGSAGITQASISTTSGTASCEIFTAF